VSERFTFVVWKKSVLPLGSYMLLGWQRHTEECQAAVAVDASSDDLGGNRT
jgi:hypothetical protein